MPPIFEGGGVEGICHNHQNLPGKKSSSTLTYEIRRTLPTLIRVCHQKIQPKLLTNPRNCLNLPPSGIPKYLHDNFSK